MKLKDCLISTISNNLPEYRNHEYGFKSSFSKIKFKNMNLLFISIFLFTFNFINAQKIELVPKKKNDVIRKSKKNIKNETFNEISIESCLNEDAKYLKFYIGTDSLLRVGKIRLTKIAALLSDATYSQLKIVSHTDQGLYLKSNIELAKDRALLIKRNLVNKGILENKIIIEPKGDSFPIIHSISSDANEKNNRIELILIKSNINY